MSFATVLSLMVGLPLGFGLALMISAKVLDKSNNLGDSMGGFDCYSRDAGIHYIKYDDDVNRREKDLFLHKYGKTGREEEAVIDETAFNS